MKTFITLLSVLFVLNGHTQGTLVFDQQSSTDEDFPYGGLSIQFYGSVGQSFTPSLSTVGFVRVKLYDAAPFNPFGATLVMNLRSNAINGPIIGTSQLLVLANGFAGSTNFIFSSAVGVIPNSTYYFETSVVSGDQWGITAMGNDYPNGNYYGGNTSAVGGDLWFREGIVVPEPTTGAVLVAGLLVASLVRNRYRQM